MIDLNNQTIIIVGILILMMLAILIDGEMGTRVFGMLMTGFGMIVSYFFVKEKVSK